MLILPAIDLRDGAVVRLHQGDFGRETVYDRQPAAVAAAFAGAGLRTLHVVDLDGTREGRLLNGPAIEAILRVEGVRVELGGGLRSRAAIDGALSQGVWRVMIGSAALRQPSMVIEAARAVGPERIALAVDVRNGRLASDGWTASSDATADEFLRHFLDVGIRVFHCTDVGRDGTLEGPDHAWIASLCARYPQAEIIAAGGVASVSDLDALRRAGAAGAVIGRALYEGHISLEALRAWTRGQA